MAVCIIHNSFFFFFSWHRAHKITMECWGYSRANLTTRGQRRILRYCWNHELVIRTPRPIKRDVGFSGPWGFVDNSQGDLGSLKITQDKQVSQGQQRIPALTQNLSSSQEVSQPTVVYWEQEHSEQDWEIHVWYWS